MLHDIASHDIHPALRTTPPTPLVRWETKTAGPTFQNVTPSIPAIPTPSFPAGTRFPALRNGRKIETRLIERIGPFPRDFAYASHFERGRDRASRFEYLPANANGTGHNIPSKQQCLQCQGITLWRRAPFTRSGLPCSSTMKAQQPLST